MRLLGKVEKRVCLGLTGGRSVGWGKRAGAGSDIIICSQSGFGWARQDGWQGQSRTLDCRTLPSLPRHRQHSDTRPTPELADPPRPFRSPFSPIPLNLPTPGPPGPTRLIHPISPHPNRPNFPPSPQTRPPPTPCRVQMQIQTKSKFKPQSKSKSNSNSEMKSEI